MYDSLHLVVARALICLILMVTATSPSENTVNGNLFPRHVSLCGSIPFLEREIHPDNFECERTPARAMVGLRGGQGRILVALRGGSATPRPLGSSTPRPLGSSTPRPLGGSTPRPLGGSTPRPLGGSTPRPSGGATPVAAAAAAQSRARYGEGFDWEVVTLPRNETDPLGGTDEVYGPPMIYPAWVRADLHHAGQGSMAAQLRLLQYILSNTSEVQWMWRNWAKEGTEEPAEGSPEDLEKGRKFAETLPDRFPWEDEAWQLEREANASKAWAAQPDRAARLLEVFNEMDKDCMIDYDKADPDCQLFHSAFEGDADEIRRVVAKTGVDIHCHNYARENYQWTALHCAASKGHLDAITAIIELGADVNRKTADGETPLHIAAREGHEAAILLLMDYGANSLAADVEGKMPFDIAQRRRHLGAVEILFQYMDAEAAQEPIDYD